MHWALKNLHASDDGEYVEQAIWNGKAIAVSDGSAKDNWSTAAFTIEGKSYGIHRVTSTCSTPGDEEEQEAYSGELLGLYAIVAT
eukprot:9445880-Ditylum_brightwellii.AAC.1